MARAGYCSACANYVYLREDGGCSNGHGPECISSPYEIGEEGAPASTQPSAFAAPQYADAGRYATPEPQIPYPAPVYPGNPPAPAAAPKKKRTGLVIALVVLGLLLLCCCGVGGWALFSGSLTGSSSGPIQNPLASEDHKKVAAAGDFVRAVGEADGAALVKVLPSEAVSAVEPSFWLETLSGAEPNATFKTSSWDGDVLTQVYTDGDGTETKMVFRAVGGDKVELVVSEDGGPGADPGFFQMKKEGAAWKVLSLGSPDGETLRFDAETVKQLQEESEGQ